MANFKLILIGFDDNNEQGHVCVATVHSTHISQYLVVRRNSVNRPSCPALCIGDVNSHDDCDRPMNIHIVSQGDGGLQGDKGEKVCSVMTTMFACFPLGFTRHTMSTILNVMSGNLHEIKCNVKVFKLNFENKYSEY